MFFITFMVFSLALLQGLRRRSVFGKEEEAVQSQVFIDKTSLIKEFFAIKHTLVTVPRGFGKTTNMDMIRRFCELQLDEEGSLISRNDTKYFKVFTKSYLKGDSFSFLDVYEDKSFFNRFFAQYPVIYIDLTPLGYESWKDFKHSLVRIINNLFNHHKHLLGHEDFSDTEKIMFRNYQFYVICKELQNTQLKESLTFLASLLSKRFNKKVILLIDELDSILHKSIMSHCNDTEKIITFMCDFICNILNSIFTVKSILNSSSKLVRILTNEAKNTDSFIFTEKHVFNRFYGFTEEEVLNLAGKFNLRNNMTAIKNWYGGYTILKSKLKMYNFNSISNVMFTKDLDTYTVKGKFPEKFERLFTKKELRRKLKTLMENGVIEVANIKKMSVKDFLRLKEVFQNPEYFGTDPTDEYLLFDYMLDLGYFTIVNYEEDSSRLKLSVPNLEAKSELMDLIYSMPYFKNKLNLTEEDFYTINETLLDSKISRFLKNPVLSSTRVHYL